MSESGKIRLTPYLNPPVLASGKPECGQADPGGRFRADSPGAAGQYLRIRRTGAAVRSAVLRLAIHLTGSPEDAQDIYQEAFLRAYINLARFRFECSFYTWIYRIVTNLCLDHLRKKNSRGRDFNTTSLPKARRKTCLTGCRITARPPARSEV